ncbi:MAG TPA: hypothetical protein VHM26_16885, partial [Chitinophagaceae bacterium]|nr:hypothetical protein [Chitinophagaceae bacterium]
RGGHGPAFLKRFSCVSLINKCGTALEEVFSPYFGRRRFIEGAYRSKYVSQTGFFKSRFFPSKLYPKRAWPAEALA